MTFKEFFTPVGAAIGLPLLQWRLHERDGLHHRHSLRSPHQSADWFAMTVEIRKLMHWSADSPRPSLRSATPLINARGKFPLSAAKASCFGACFSSYIAVPHPSRLSPGHLPPGGRFCGVPPLAMRAQMQWGVLLPCSVSFLRRNALSAQCAHWAPPPKGEASFRCRQFMRRVLVRAFRHISPFLIRPGFRRATFPPGEGFFAAKTIPSGVVLRAANQNLT